MQTTCTARNPRKSRRRLCTFKKSYLTIRNVSKRLQTPIAFMKTVTQKDNILFTTAMLPRLELKQNWTTTDRQVWLGRLSHTQCNQERIHQRFMKQLRRRCQHPLYAANSSTMTSSICWLIL